MSPSFVERIKYRVLIDQLDLGKKIEGYRLHFLRLKISKESIENKSIRRHPQRLPRH